MRLTQTSGGIGTIVRPFCFVGQHHACPSTSTTTVEPPPHASCAMALSLE